MGCWATRGGQQALQLGAPQEVGGTCLKVQSTSIVFIYDLSFTRTHTRTPVKPCACTTQYHPRPFTFSPKAPFMLRSTLLGMLCAVLHPFCGFLPNRAKSHSPMHLTHLILRPNLILTHWHVNCLLKDVFESLANFIFLCVT